MATENHVGGRSLAQKAINQGTIGLFLSRPSVDLHTLRSRAQPQFKFSLVATNYFTKWIEVVPLQSHGVTDSQILMEEPHMSLQPPAHHHIRQQDKRHQ